MNTSFALAAWPSFALLALSCAAYEPGIGRLPAAKAKADADRLAAVVENFQNTRLNGNCVYTTPKKGPIDMLGLLNEEGRGYNPPRSGHEVELYKRIKEMAERGERIDPESLLAAALDVCAGNGKEVYLQDAFLAIHNVTRLLARPECWWNDGGWENQKDLSGIGLPDVKLSRRHWQGGWRGMQNDSMFPIVQDVVGHKSVDGKPTLAHIRGETFDRSTPEGEAKFQAYNSKLRQVRQNRVDNLNNAISLENDVVYRASAQTNRLQKIHPFQRDGNWADEFARQKALIQAARDRLEILNAELAQRSPQVDDDITGNVRDLTYTHELFSPDPDGHGVFSPLYGAEEREGNGGNWYYFWLGAFVETAGGSLANVGGAAWETLQLNAGEKGRKAIQISHFSGGGIVSERLRAKNVDCIKKMQELKGGAKKINEAFVTAKKDISDWYCTNRPWIEMVLDVPRLVSKHIPAPTRTPPPPPNLQTEDWRDRRNPLHEVQK